MKTKEEFSGRLPNGKITVSIPAYLRAWRKQNRAIERILGVTIHSFDMGCSVNNPSGQGVTSLPQWLCDKLIQLETK